MSGNRPVRVGRRRAVAIAAGALLLTGAVTLPAAADVQRRPAFTLTILSTNDAESQLLGVDADVDGDGTIAPEERRAFGGAARVATLMRDLRHQATHGRPRPGWSPRRGAVVLSGGDNYLAGPEFAASVDKGVPYYDALAMRAIGYDATTIGNHEFDFGPDVLADFIASFDGSMTFVSANLDVSEEPRLAAYTKTRTLVSSHVVRERGERIGIIGLTTPELPTISSPRKVKVLEDLAGVTNRIAADMQRRGINKIILASHLQDIDNERALVPKLSGVDVVLAAGGGETLANSNHRLVPGDVADLPYPVVTTDKDGRQVPIVTTQGDYKYISRLVVHFDRHGNVIGRDDDVSGPVRVSGVQDDAVARDPAVVRTVEEPVQRFLDGLAETTVAQSDVPLDGVRTTVRSQETNLANLLADALRWEGAQQADEYGVPVPQVGIQNGGGIRNNSVLPAGPVTALNTYEVAPFANFVAVIPEVPRETLRQLLERGVAAAPEAAGAFVQVSGLTFTYDTTKQAQVVDETTGEIITPGQRVQRVVLDDGTVIVDNGQVVAGAPVSVATNDFSARGGDAYPLKGLAFTPVGKTYQQALAEYLEIGLSGKVTAAQYPVGGNGRIVRLA